MRFASHRDVARAVERGVRRAGLPIAYSAGFTPHPRISYAGAAPTGTASEAEYLELSLTQGCGAPEVRERLDAALPDGIDVIEVTEGPVSLGALPLEASQWQAVLPGVPPHEAARAVAAFLACETVEVERLTNKGPRRVDARAAVISVDVSTDPAGAAGPARRRMAASPGPAMLARGDNPPEPPGGNAILRMVVRHVIPAVRPDDVFAALRRVAGLTPPSPPVVTRLAQGPLSALRRRVPAPRWPQASGGEAGDARLSAAPRPRGWGAAAKESESARPGDGAAPAAATIQAGACDQLPRGAEQPAVASAPGSLTGDSPNARQRAARNRARQ